MSGWGRARPAVTLCGRVWGCASAPLPLAPLANIGRSLAGRTLSTEAIRSEGSRLPRTNAACSAATPFSDWAASWRERTRESGSGPGSYASAQFIRGRMFDGVVAAGTSRVGGAGCSRCESTTVGVGGDVGCGRGRSPSHAEMSRKPSASEMGCFTCNTTDGYTKRRWAVDSQNLSSARGLSWTDRSRSLMASSTSGPAGGRTISMWAMRSEGSRCSPAGTPFPLSRSRDPELV